MRKTLNNLVMAIAVLALLTSCKSGPLLKGTAKFIDKETEFAINYIPGGNIYAAQSVFFKLDENGNFEFDVEMEDESGDYEIYVGNALYGVHLEKGKTAVLNIVETEAGKYACSFSGDNADISEVMSTAFPAYDLYTYSTMSDENGTPEVFLARLEKANEGAMAKLDLIGDKEVREWYGKRLNAMYLGTKARILQDKAYDEGKSEKDMPEYMEIINGIDPNGEISCVTNNSLLWIGAMHKEDIGDNMLPYCMETMDIVEKNIINAKVKKTMAYAVANMFFAYGDHETGKEDFWARYKEFAKDYPEYIEMFQKEYEKKVESAEGMQMPDIDLTKEDGSKVKLSSLYGKYIYVDCWATWCGPCCKEIPHLEELVGRMIDQDKVVFVSLSMDSDVDAWKRKIADDKPEWAQFILDADANKMLSEALNITGIPRFFIIDPEGKVLNADAKRPSDKELEEELRKL